MCPKLQLAQLYLVRMTAGHLFHHGVGMENRNCLKWDSVSPTLPQDMNIAIRVQKSRKTASKITWYSIMPVLNKNKMDHHLIFAQGKFLQAAVQIVGPT